ncbi:MAG TPA: hypothetical protein VFB96_09560 [Pirellulaceae bacterium]|nr:hypothetical protein [Pirellulaceae bacterium]
MDRIRRQDVEKLLAHERGPFVSIFQPLHPTGRDGMEDAVRLRKLADRAAGLLIDRGLRRPEAESLLAPVRQLPDDDVSWQKRGRSLAAFVAPGLNRVFHGNGQREEALFVDDRFHVRLLLPLVSQDDKFFVLALSQNSVRLFQGNELVLKPIDVAGLPRNRDEALNIDEVPRGSQVHSGMRGDQGQGKQAAVFHGQGGRPETMKEELLLFVRQVAHAVDRRLERERAPLILATVVATVPLWKETSKYPCTMEDFVSGNPDHLSPSELHAKAWTRVQPVQLAERKSLLDRIHEKDNPRASFGLTFVVSAAIRGQVDSLFIDCSRPWWGKYDAENDTVLVHAQPQPGDSDLVELAASATLQHGGRVFPITPENSNPDAAAQALLRY